MVSKENTYKGASLFGAPLAQSTGNRLLAKALRKAMTGRASFTVEQAVRIFCMQFVLAPVAYALPKKLAVQIGHALALVLLILPRSGLRVYWQMRNAFGKGRIESLYLAWGWLATQFIDVVIIKRLSYGREDLSKWKIIERNVDRINSLRESGEPYIVVHGHFLQISSLGMSSPNVTYGQPVVINDPVLKRVQSLYELRLRIDDRTYHKAYPRWGRDWVWVYNNELSAARKLYRRLHERGNVVFIPVDKPWRENSYGAYARPFAGKKKCVFSTGAAALARLARCPIISCVPVLERDGTIVVEWGEPIRIVGEDEANDLKVMDELLDALEIGVGERPTQYKFEIGGDRRWNPRSRRWEDLTE
jgi:lauroyl/myristoyl acyltransferase